MVEKRLRTTVRTTCDSAWAAAVRDSDSNCLRSAPPSPKRQIVFLTAACRFDSSPSVSCREELTKARNILESLSVGDDPVLAQKLIDVDRDCMNMARELEDSKSKVRTYRLGDDRGRFSSGNISLCMLNLNAGRNFGLLHSTNDCLQAFTTQRLMFRPR